MSDSLEGFSDIGVTRRMFVCSALSGCLKAFAQRPREPSVGIRGRGEDIVFDPRSLEEILQWAHGESAEPTDWRHQRPYELATEQAKWNGRPDPNDEVHRQLMRIRQRRDEALVKESLDGTDGPFLIYARTCQLVHRSGAW